MKKCSGFEVFAGSDRGFSRKLKFKKNWKKTVRIIRSGFLVHLLHKYDVYLCRRWLDCVIWRTTTTPSPPCPGLSGATWWPSAPTAATSKYGTQRRARSWTCWRATVPAWGRWPGTGTCCPVGAGTGSYCSETSEHLPQVVVSSKERTFFFFSQPTERTERKFWL